MFWFDLLLVFTSQELKLVLTFDDFDDFDVFDDIRFDLRTPFPSAFSGCDILFDTFCTSIPFSMFWFD